MSANTAVQGGQNSGPGKSPGLWMDCPWMDIVEGRDPNTVGVYSHFDFRKMKLSTNINAAIAYWDQGLLAFGSDGAVIAALAAQNGGVTISSDGDNEGLSFQQVVAPYKISRATKRLWFEVRIKRSAITDTKFGAFFGLGELMTLSATVPIAAAGTIADQNLVGWHILEGDGDQADFIYKANGVTQVTLRTDAISGGIVADTWVKLGFKWDPADKDGPNLLTMFVDGGCRTTTAGLAGYTMASADGTDFPNDVILSPMIALLNATGTTPGTLSISDLWCAQLL